MGSFQQLPCGGLQEIQMSLCYSLMYGRQLSWSWGENAAGQIMILVMLV